LLASSDPTTVSIRSFGKLPDGTEAELITLRSPLLELSVTDSGARVVSLLTPDRHGCPGDIALGYRDAASYATTRNAYFGATAGRVANRIARGTFLLDGERYRVPANNGLNALHGGPLGFDRCLWQSRLLPDGVEFALTSEDGDQGFPGELLVTAGYRLAGNWVQLTYTAKTSKPTVVNLTNHTYFNLDGEGEPSILDHELTLYADHLTPIDETLIPTGTQTAVYATPFDFTRGRRIGARIDIADVQLQRAGGYDHNFVLQKQSGELRPAARVRSSASGRVLEVATTEPGIQFYSGNFLNGSLVGRSGRPYERRSAFCLETQHFPDTPNQPTFPSVRLDPGMCFRSETTWTLGVD
jgi:aldose 1-epimerase